jgi:hypothetical protein
MDSAGLPLLILGWCSLVYGITEVINSLKIHNLHKKADRQREELERQRSEEESKVAEEISSEINKKPENNTPSEEGDYPDFVG